MVVTHREIELTAAVMVLLGVFMLLEPSSFSFGNIDLGITGLAIGDDSGWVIGNEFSVGQSGSLTINLNVAFGNLKDYRYEAVSSTGIDISIIGNVVTFSPNSNAEAVEQITLRAIGENSREHTITVRVEGTEIDIGPALLTGQQIEALQKQQTVTTAETQEPVVAQEAPQETISEPAFQGQEILTDESKSVGKKIQDDPDFDVHFTKVEKGNTFRLEFFHDSDVPQPVAIEGIKNYRLSHRVAGPHENVIFEVDLVSGKVPNFDLKVGAATEIFSFGESTFETQPIVEEPEEPEPAPPPAPPPSFGAQTTISSCQTISVSGDYNLSQDISGTGDCITITASDVTLNCEGFKITYGTSGGSSANAIVASSVSGLDIFNCTMQDGAAGGSSGIGILFTTVTDSTIRNNSINTNGSSSNIGIRLTSNADRNTIMNNTIRTRGTSSSNRGIYTTSSTDSTIIRGNVIFTNGTGTNVGIQLDSNSDNVIVDSNTISTGGTSTNNYGINLNNADNVNVTDNFVMTRGSSNARGFFNSAGQAPRVEGNTFITSGSSGSNYGIATRGTSGRHGNYTNNIVITNGTTANYGIWSDGGTVNRFENNSITTDGNSSDGIRMQTNTNNNDFIGNNITTLGGNTNYGIRISAGGHRIRSNNINTSGLGSHGIFLDESSSTMNITGNTILTPVAEGLYVGGTFILSFTSNEVTSDNTVNGRQIFYYGGAGNSPTCPDNTLINNPSAGHITLIRCTGVNIINFDMEDAITLVATNLSDVNNSIVCRSLDSRVPR